jgi:outer membrane receptor protein involved in Fe transport
VNRGVEAGLDMRLSAAWSWFANASYQDRPEVTGLGEGEVNLPPEYRFNLGASFHGDRLFASANVNHADGAFWTDVLDSRYFGPTEAYTQLNATIGARLADERYVVSLIAQNLTDERVQQHVFGDIISRKVVLQLGLRF